MRVAIAQINPTVGDIDGNAKLVTEEIARAKGAGADLVVMPELALFGYPPKDLVRRADVVERNEAALRCIANGCVGISAIVGYARRGKSDRGRGLFNDAALLQDGRVVASYSKMLLPTYDVFDESRYFDAGSDVCVVDIPTASGVVRAGITICEDLWHDEQFAGRTVYGIDPIAATVAGGAELIVNLSGSPFRVGVQARREALFIRQVKRLNVPLVYVNQASANDDLIFDGASLVIDAGGAVVARARAFEPESVVVDLGSTAGATAVTAYPDRVSSVRRALVLGIRDYLRKTAFEAVVVGLSGGIDSALTVALAVEALGAARVHAVALPSRFSSDHSVADAEALAQCLGVELRHVPIEPMHAATEAALEPIFVGTAPGVAEENIQARIRGAVLMALSNKFGWLLLTTGNKSELAVGYCTLYGDMCGGLAVLSDVPKTLVYELAKLINSDAGRDVIPQHTIDKAPSAELREGQTDQDSLPPYDVLDAIIEAYVERDLSVDAIVNLGYECDIVDCVTRMIDCSEYKRQQAAVGLKVTSRAFGTGRRMPIAATFR